MCILCHNGKRSCSLSTLTQRKRSKRCRARWAAIGLVPRWSHPAGETATQRPALASPPQPPPAAHGRAPPRNSLLGPQLLGQCQEHIPALGLSGRAAGTEPPGPWTTRPTWTGRAHPHGRAGTRSPQWARAARRGRKSISGTSRTFSSSDCNIKPQNGGNGRSYRGFAEECQWLNGASWDWRFC